MVIAPVLLILKVSSELLNLAEASVHPAIVPVPVTLIVPSSKASDAVI